MCVYVMLGLCSVVTGCSKRHADQVVRPRLGTVFTYREFDIARDLREIAGTSRQVTLTVVDTNARHGDKVRLALFQSGLDSLFVSYDSTGDVLWSMAHCSGSEQSCWLRLPIATTRLAVLDTGSSKENLATFHTYLLALNDRPESESTPAGEFGVRRIMLVIHSTSPQNRQNSQVIHFAPDLGVPARQEWTGGELPATVYQRVRVLIGVWHP